MSTRTRSLSTPMMTSTIQKVKQYANNSNTKRSVVGEPRSMGSMLIKSVIAVVFLSLGLTLLLTGLLPMLFVSVVLLLPAVIPMLLVLGCVYATNGDIPETDKDKTFHNGAGI